MMSDNEKENSSCKGSKKSSQAVVNRRRSSEKSNNLTLRKQSKALVSKKKENEPEVILPISSKIAPQMDYSFRHFSDLNNDICNFQSDICFRQRSNGLGVEVECVKRILREKNVIGSSPGWCETNIESVPGAGIFNLLPDMETSKRVCEKHVQDLQEKLLKSEQEAAAAKLKYHQTEKQLIELQEVLQNVGISWQKMEDAIKHMQEENFRIKEHTKLTNEKNELLQEELRISENQRTSLQKQTEQTVFSTNLRISYLEKVEETLQKQLVAEQESSIKYQEDLQNLRKQLFHLQQEIQDLSRSKLEQERTISVELNCARQALEEEKRSVRSLIAEKENVLGQLEDLSIKCKAMQQEHHTAQEEKDSVVIEFRRSEAQKIAQEYEHAASLQNVANQLQKDLDSKVSELEQAHKQELQQVLTVTQGHLEGMKKNQQREIDNIQYRFAELFEQKDKCLEDVTAENQKMLKKFEELESGRSQLLSKLQIHLQNQWLDAVEILYSSPTIDMKEMKHPSALDLQPSNLDRAELLVQTILPMNVPDKVPQTKLNDPLLKHSSLNLQPSDTPPHSTNFSKIRSKLTLSPVQTSSTPLPSDNNSKTLSRLSHSGFTLSPTLRLEDFGISNLSPVVGMDKENVPTKLQPDLYGSFASTKERTDLLELAVVNDKNDKDLKCQPIEKLNLDEEELSARKLEVPQVCIFNDRSQKLQQYINKLLEHSPSTSSPAVSKGDSMCLVLTPEQDKPQAN